MNLTDPSPPRRQHGKPAGEATTTDTCSQHTRAGRRGGHEQRRARSPSVTGGLPHLCFPGAAPVPGHRSCPRHRTTPCPAVSSPDNGPCFKSVRFAAYIERRPELIHIRTRRKSPNQNGVRERAFGSLKYEHLYRLEIDDGHQLGHEVEAYRQLFNQVRPHEGIAMRRPLDVHLEASNDRQTTNSTEPETLPLS